jgi:hypothetical protein
VRELWAKSSQSASELDYIEKATLRPSTALPSIRKKESSLKRRPTTALSTKYNGYHDFEDRRKYTINDFSLRRYALPSNTKEPTSLKIATEGLRVAVAETDSQSQAVVQSLAFNKSNSNELPNTPILVTQANNNTLSPSSRRPSNSILNENDETNATDATSISGQGSLVDILASNGTNPFKSKSSKKYGQFVDSTSTPNSKKEAAAPKNVKVIFHASGNAQLLRIKCNELEKKIEQFAIDPLTEMYPKHGQQLILTRKISAKPKSYVEKPGSADSTSRANLSRRRASMALFLYGQK